MSLNTPCRGHLPQHEVAGPLYLRARKWLAASQCFEQVDNFGRALKVLDEQEMYDQAMDCLQRYKIRKQVRLYHWQELPQVSFLSQQKICHDKHEFKTCPLPWKMYACSDKTFVVTNLCLSFVATKIFCHNKHVFCCCDKHTFVATKVSLSWQNFCCDKIVCHDKYLSQQKYVCCDKSFVATSMLLLQKTCVCRDKMFVTTKMVLVAAPADDTTLHQCCTCMTLLAKSHLYSWTVKCWWIDQSMVGFWCCNSKLDKLVIQWLVFWTGVSEFWMHDLSCLAKFNLYSWIVMCWQIDKSLVGFWCCYSKLDKLVV